MSKIDPLSRCSIALKLWFQSQTIGHATGFLWRHKGAVFLITNWHVVTGRNPNTLLSVNPTTAAEPDQLTFSSWNAQGKQRDHLIDLYDASFRPIWLVHSEFGIDRDVVAISLGRRITDVPFVNVLAKQSAELEIGSPLFVLGYPFVPERYPIWKLATVASEPALTPNLRPYMLIDTASRPGMSGSPVIQRALSARDGSILPETIVGVYSGRLHTQSPMDAQLGMVWPSNIISEIAESGVTDIHPHERQIPGGTK